MTLVVFRGQEAVEHTALPHCVFSVGSLLNGRLEAPPEFELGGEHGFQVDDGHLLQELFGALRGQHTLVVVPARPLDLEPEDLAACFGLLLDAHCVPDLGGLGVEAEFVELQAGQAAVLLAHGCEVALGYVDA